MDHAALREFAIRKHSDSLPGISFAEEISVGILLRIRLIFDSSISTTNQAVVSMEFDNVSEEIAVEGDIRRVSKKLNVHPLLLSLTVKTCRGAKIDRSLLVDCTRESVRSRSLTATAALQKRSSRS